MPDLLSSILPESFNFAQGTWLWSLTVIPVVWLLFALFYRSHGSAAQKLKDFADPHLIPHLLEDSEAVDKKTGRPWKALALWSLLWALGVLALAGPRWDFTTVKAFAPASQLVIVLDMSRSMDASDIRPSRLARARQEIEDILNAEAGTNIALVAFDAVPHMITPLSDDVSSIRRLLPSLTSDIVYTQGADLAAALNMAAEMLESAPGTNKHVLILSDGEFESSDAALYRATQRLGKAGARLHGFGFGTAEGAPVPGSKGGLVKDGNGQAVITRLNEERFIRIVRDGGGLYKRASYLSDDTNALLSQIKTLGTADKKTQKTTMFWEERFYIFLLPALLLFLPWLRRGAAFPALVLFFILQTSSPAQAFEWQDLFLNRQQQAARAVEEKQYDQAVQNFDDPYQKGVAQYRAGDYQGAAQSFSAGQSKGAKARYNLGNAQLMGGQIEEAIKTYEEVLKNNPDHEDARHNLEIAKKLLEQQKQQQQQNQNQNNQQNQDQDKQDQSGGSGQDEQNQDKKNQGENDQNQNEQSGENDSASDQKGQEQAEGEKPNEQGEEDKRKQEEQSGAQGDEDKRDQEQKDEDGQRKGQSAAQDESEKKQDIDQQAGQNADRKPETAPEQLKEQEQTPRPGTQESGRQTRPRTQKDINADQWLERMESDPEQFLKNKFYIESQRAGATKGDDKW